MNTNTSDLRAMTIEPRGRFNVQRWRIGGFVCCRTCDAPLSQRQDECEMNDCGDCAECQEAYQLDIDLSAEDF